MILFLGLAASAASYTPKPINPVTWVTAADYPNGPLAHRTHGVTGYKLEVDAGGLATGCHVTMSSGDPDLDAVACPLLKARARFVPARDRHYKPIASTYNGKVRWTLPGS
jgi:periplasmic protein TonB